MLKTESIGLNWRIGVLIIILCAAVVPRLYYLNADRNVKLAYFPGTYVGFGNKYLLGMDGMYYDKIASNIVRGRGYGYEPDTPDAWRPPGYPFFLATVYFLFGRLFYIVRFAQVCFSVMTVLIIYLLGKRILNETAALFASLICALYYDSVVFTFVFYSETLFTLCVAIILYLLYSLDLLDPKAVMDKIYLLGIGLLCGYAVLIRPVFVLILPFLFAVILIKQGVSKQTVYKIVLLGVGVAIVVIPWCVRNSIVYKKPSFIATNGGFNFSIGFCSNAQGFFLFDGKRFTDTEQKIEKERGVLYIGLTFIKDYPLQALKLFIKKIYLQLFYPSVARNIVFLGKTKIPLFGYTPYIMILFLLGVIASFFTKPNRWYLLYAYVLGYLICYGLFFYLGDRHRIPLVIAYSLFGGYFIDRSVCFFTTRLFKTND